MRVEHLAVTMMPVGLLSIRETFPRRHIAALLIWQACLAILWVAGYTR